RVAPPAGGRVARAAARVLRTREVAARAPRLLGQTPAVATDPDLGRLRDQIAALDREVLQTLNRRLELVARVQEHKQESGAPLIDAAREAELLQDLVDANGGPLSERAVRSTFAAVLDVMKQELRGEPRQGSRAAQAPARVEIQHVAVIGTGLVGASVALAAKRAGVARVSGWDADDATRRAAAAAGAIAGAAGSLQDAVADAELVVVAVPVGALAATTRDVLAAASTDATVTDVGSTKRGLTEIDDARFVPGHPLAGGATGGPARAAADLFDAATWFLTPLPSSDPERVALVERFVGALGARAVRLTADDHDRLLALTSHLPHALANLLMRQVARASGEHDQPLALAGASLRE